MWTIITTIYISLWTNYNWIYWFGWRYCTNIYISLWTNYNLSSIEEIHNLKTFTFHYELIITEDNTEAKVNLKIFTFHYELIITLTKTFEANKETIFTFHYELIITEQKIRRLWPLWIYISLWTNYNFYFIINIKDTWLIYISLWTNYNLSSIEEIHNLKTFTFHYELIITEKHYHLYSSIPHLHFTMN